MKNRIISIITVVLIFLSAFTPAHGASIDFESHTYDNEVAFLRTLGFIDDKIDDNLSTATVSRGEYAAMMVRAVGQEDYAQRGVFEQKFKDVPKSHTYYNYISASVELGLFNGTSNGTFEPNMPVTMNQAVTVAVKAINMNAIAEAKGGYPAGYIRVASENELLKNVKQISDSSDARRADIYVLLYNTLHANIAIYDSISGGDFGFTIYEGKNLLSENHKIYWIEGVIEANSVTSVDGNTTAEGEIRIGSNILYSDIKHTEDSVGKRVLCYYKEDSKGKKNVVAVETSRDNKMIVISSDDIVGFDSQSGIYTISDSKEDVKIKIGTSYSLIYNKKYLRGSNVSVMKPNAGTVTLVDNNDDNIYDVVFVDEFFNIVVDKYDSVSNIICDANPNQPIANKSITRTIKINDFDNVFADFEFANLEKGDIISVYISLDNKVVTLAETREKILGTVNELEQNEYGTSYVIGGVSYKLSKDVRFSPSSIVLGADYTIYLDAMGRIANAIPVTNSSVGYMLEISNPTGSLDKSIYARLMLLSGDVLELKLAEKICLRTHLGKTYVNDENLKASFNSERNNRGLIMYEFNDENELDTIILPHIVNTEDEYNDMPNYPLIKINYFALNWPEGRGKTFGGMSTGGFSNWMNFTSSAKVITVPPEDSSYSENNLDSYDIDMMDTSKSLVAPASADELRTEGMFDAYKTRLGSRLPDILVIHQQNVDRVMRQDHFPSVVTKVVTAYNEEIGEAVQRLSLITKDSEEVLDVEPGCELKSIAVGDAIKYKLNSNGRIKTIEHHFSRSQDKVLHEGADSVANLNKLYRLTRGEIIYADSESIELLSSFEGTECFERMNLSTPRVVLVDEKLKTVTLANKNLIIPGDQVLVYTRWLVPNLIVVYRRDY